MQKPKIIFAILLLLSAFNAFSQDDVLRRMQGAGGRFGRQGGPASGQGDSLQHRTGQEDSITINFRYLDSTRLQGFDTTVTDYTKRFPLPWHHVHLGNSGTASRSLLFGPRMHSGWDHGFHAFDTYRFTVEGTRFYNTTRPFSQMGYQLGSQAEQMIHLLHTQNVMPNWNVAIEYRMLNSPGFFFSQNTNHNNYRVSSWYQSRNKRYQNFVVFVGNKLQSSENGGILQDADYLGDITFNDRYNIPTEIGSQTGARRNLFTTEIGIGNRFTTNTFMFRQQYDIGQKDSLVTDSTVIPLFYPRLRLEHTTTYNTYHYRFSDDQPDTDDTAYYPKNYQLRDSVIFLRDHWRELINDFSFYTFPDARNPQQFLKLGAAMQNLSGSFDSGKLNRNYYNLIAHGEYRNKTKNQKWDIEASGRFHFAGLNAGDYQLHASLQRMLSRKLGYLKVGFQNVNRTPSFTFNPESSFYLESGAANWNKENTVRFFGSFDMQSIGLQLTGDYYLLNNYTYFRNFYQPAQVSSLFNILRVSAEKRFRLGRRGWNWRPSIVLQQRAGDAPVNLPLLLTRNILAYDGNFGFKNLLISLGLEMRYFTPFMGDAYSPVTGQFFYQDSARVQMNLPEVGAFVHFRIRTFSAYFRVENLNTFDIARGGFLNNNILVPGYPYPGMLIRLGIFWNFIN